jgi:hypothetical protein
MSAQINKSDRTPHRRLPRRAQMRQRSVPPARAAAVAKTIMVSRRLERHLLIGAQRPDSLAGAAGILNFASQNLNSRRLLARGGRIRRCASRPSTSLPPEGLCHDLRHGDQAILAKCPDTARFRADFPFCAVENLG